MRFIIRREIIKMLIEMTKNANVEVCGFLLGRKEGPGKINSLVLEARGVRNRLKSPHAFEMEPEDMVRVLDESEKRGLEVVGIFHSHLKCPPVLSKRDLEGMKNWPVVWLIITPEGEMRAWVLREGKVEEVEIRVA
ncbi:M67 family metallopeptidase [Thermococcus sp.]